MIRLNNRKILLGLAAAMVGIVATAGIANAGVFSACQSQPFGGPIPVPPPGTYQDRECEMFGVAAGTCVPGPQGCVQFRSTGGQPSVCGPGITPPGTIEYKCQNLTTGSW
jgi:hypothetical protein